MSDASVPVTYRRATVGDAEATFEIVKAAVNDLLVRNGRQPTAGSGLPPERVLRFRRSQVAADPDGFWVAEADGVMVGAAIGVRREAVWYLAALHVLPGWQGRGVGTELLRRSLGNATDPRLTRTVLTDASNSDSNGLYLRFGMLPIDSTLSFDGPAIGVPATSQAAMRPIDPVADAAPLAVVDRETVGFARPVDHAFWADVPGLHGWLLLRDGEVRGYLYVSERGAVGPVAVHDPDDLPAALDAAAALAADAGATTLHVRVFGTTHGAIEWATAHGLRLSGIGLFLASAPVGRFAGYVTSGADALY